jgi:hypothetical protein
MKKGEIKARAWRRDTRRQKAKTQRASSHYLNARSWKGKWTRQKKERVRKTANAGKENKEQQLGKKAENGECVGDSGHKGGNSPASVTGDGPLLLSSVCSPPAICQYPAPFYIEQDLPRPPDAILTTILPTTHLFPPLPVRASLDVGSAMRSFH